MCKPYVERQSVLTLFVLFVFYLFCFLVEGGGWLKGYHNNATETARVIFALTQKDAAGNGITQHRVSIRNAL